MNEYSWRLKERNFFYLFFSVSILLCHLRSGICSGLAKLLPCCFCNSDLCDSDQGGVMKSLITILELHLTARAYAPYGMFSTILINNRMVCFSTASSFMFSHVGEEKRSLKNKPFNRFFALSKSKSTKCLKQHVSASTGSSSLSFWKLGWTCSVMREPTQKIYQHKATPANQG